MRIMYWTLPRLVVLLVVLGTFGFDTRGQRPTPRNTIRLSVAQPRQNITGDINQRLRYKMIIGKPGGMLKVDHIKRIIRLEVSLYDSEDTRLPFIFEEDSETYVAPGVYVLELVNKGERRGRYMFRLTLQPKPTGGNWSPDKIGLPAFLEY